MLYIYYSPNLLPQDIIHNFLHCLQNHQRTKSLHTQCVISFHIYHGSQIYEYKFLCTTYIFKLGIFSGFSTCTNFQWIASHSYAIKLGLVFHKCLQYSIKLKAGQSGMGIALKRPGPIMVGKNTYQENATINSREPPRKKRNIDIDI